MTDNKKHALIAEGGAMRGIFATGVLDHFLMERYRPFDLCIGVSAGATTLMSWLSNQYQRNYKVVTDYSCRPQFINIKKYLRGGHWVDIDWLWEITLREIPFDYESFNHETIPLYMVTTDITTGKPCYIQATEESIPQLSKASCAIPPFYRGFPLFDGKKMSDGGAADSIPVEKAYEMGAKEITVILSQPLGFRKKPIKSAWLTKRLLRKAPALAEALISRATRYNRSLDFIKNPPSDCKINIIAPPQDFPVGRTTTDQKKLEIGYNMGLDAAKVHLESQ